MVLAAAGLSGCQGITLSSAQLRVIDASPDAGVIDSYQNSSALAYNLGFGTMTSYIPMSPGVYNLAADKAGSHQTLVANTETLVANKQYTEIIGAGLANMQQTLYLDQSTPAAAGRIAVRVINETTLASSTVTLLSGAQVDYASGAVRTVVLIDQQATGAQHNVLTPGVQAIVADDTDAQ
jgi:hypothetical protein